MPARRELHTGRCNFLHRSWGPLEPFDFSMPRELDANGIHTHLITDHQHYMRPGGFTFHPQYTTWEYFRGQTADNWIPEVGFLERYADAPNLHHRRGKGVAHDAANRTALKGEADWPQAQCFQAGLDFLERNAARDNWFLQIETFDPHEPFVAPEKYRRLYDCGSAEEGAFHDWPAYQRVTEAPETCDKVRREYAALLSFCDAQLGRIFDFMDTHGLWEDTMLIVNTDHGFLLDEHDWWGKGKMPWYEETSHIPLFIWDPRCRRTGERCPSLVQTIDLPATLLEYFSVDLPESMQGRPLRDAIARDAPVRETALFGQHGHHVNLTDGRYVYMRAPVSEQNEPLFEYTLMPTKYNAQMFPADEWNAFERVPPFPFTNGYDLLRIPCRRQPRAAPDILKTNFLFDLETDPRQETNLAGQHPQLEQHLAALIADAMHANDAPPEQFQRLGLEPSE